MVQDIAIFFITSQDYWLFPRKEKLLFGIVYGERERF